ncbi:hypothetical protein [Klebsiella pneumoniae]|uniref:hypothetical protein n=1 Tax=Klebsiella pneumoniae TaxID=573 RepID=UPI003981BA75
MIKAQELNDVINWLANPQAFSGNSVERKLAVYTVREDTVAISAVERCNNLGEGIRSRIAAGFQGQLMLWKKLSQELLLQFSESKKN